MRISVKRYLSGFVATVSLISFAACSGEGTTRDTAALDETVSDTTTAAETTINYYPDTTGVNLDGAAFGLLYFSNELSHGWTGIPTDMNPTEATGDVLGDAVYDRNRAVEEKVGVVISEYPVKGYDGVNTTLQQSVMAEDNLYDLAFQSIVGIKGLAEAGLVQDMRKLDLNTDAPWYDQKSVEELTISGKLFYANTDISYIDKLATIGVFYNKSLAKDHGIEDMYTLVDEGKWTYDTMLELAAKATDDVNGDGVYDKADSYGILCQNDGSYYLLHASGLKVGDNTGDSLRFAAGDENFIDCLQDIRDLMDTNDYFNTHKQNATLNECIQMFSADRGLFMIRPLQSVFTMRAMDSDFGIIPMPRYFEEDENYYTPTNIYPGIIMTVPKNTKNADYISLMIELLASESYDNVMPVLYDTVLDTKLSRDDVTSRMLDIIFDNRLYDLGLIWDIGGFRTAIVSAEPMNIASTVASIKEKANTEIADLFASMKKIDG